jgi:putative ABC transport system permease protein
MFGIQVIHPREQGLYAAMNGVDFAGLFLALGFFIIVAAVLLMLIPVSEMLNRRQSELHLFQALGYTRGRITRMLWWESAPIVLMASIAGVVTGLLYTLLVLWLLGSVWQGATHTEGFALYPSALTVAVGFMVGVLLSLGLLYVTIRRTLKERKALTIRRHTSLQWKRALAMLLTVVTVATLVINALWIQSVVLFVLIGVLLIGTATVWGNYVIIRKGTNTAGKAFHTEQMVWSSLLASRKQAILSFVALAAGVFIVFSVGLNRKGFADNNQIRTGTGGYSLWCESTVPIYHNLATNEGREKLSLTSLPTETDILQCVRYSADDASCLNLSKVTTPTVLGVDMSALQSSDFQVAQSIYAPNRDSVFRPMQAKSGSV